jgi:hypothetical protein
MVPSNRVLFIAVADYFCPSKQKGTASHHPPMKSRLSWGAGNSIGAMSIEKIPLNAGAAGGTEATYGVGSLL